MVAHGPNLPTTPPARPARGKPWRVMEGVLKVLTPLTWVASLLFVPEWVVGFCAERNLRRRARPERGVGGLVSSEAVELLRPHAPALVIPLASIRRARWMLLPRNRLRGEDLYVVRVEDRQGNAWLVEDPPPGFTRTLAGRGLVSRFAYGKPLEWTLLAAWWALLGYAAYTWVPWAAIPEAWREANATVTKP